MAMEGRAMDALKAQLAKIQQQLGGLTASQKMLTASLAAIMVMTLLWWGLCRNGGHGSRPGPVAALEDIGRIKTKLTASGIDARVDGDRVMVPADKKDEAVAMLALEQMLPEDISGAMASAERSQSLHAFRDRGQDHQCCSAG